MADSYSYTYTTNHTKISHSNNPSFSSTLLDEICRSIDQPTMKNRDDANVRGLVFKTEEEMANYQRACMIEKWMEKKVTEKTVVRRKPIGDVSRKIRCDSSSSSSDSSCGGGGFFSSSEAESFPLVQRPKPVRTGGLGFEKEKSAKNRDSENRRGIGDELDLKHVSGFLKTKSRALKIYGDLKKIKRPISPGGKVAAFLNSFFTAGKPKCSGDDLKSTNTSTCSSASSFSRSCLSKTPSSRGKSSGHEKRAVRFSPMNAVIDDNCQPYGHRSLAQENSNNINIIKNVIDESARDFLINYSKKDQMGCEFEGLFDHLSKSNVENQGFDQEFDEEEDEDDDDDFDGASYASSDLFELSNLSVIGMDQSQMYREELPVYETTNLDKIHTVANGLIL